MLRCPINNILVKIESRYDDELHFKSGVKLHIDPTWNPNFHATITGKIISLPIAYTADRRKITQQLEVGEEILFSYKVVGDTSFENNSKAFRMVTKGEGYQTLWQNSDREELIMMKGPKCWAAAYSDAKGEPIAGKTGTFSEVENWVGTNFKFTSAQGFTYDHVVEHEGETYWKVDISFVFAVKRKGSWVMLGDYVMVEPLVEKKPELLTTTLYRTEGDLVVVREDKGWVRSISKYDKWLGVLPGDVVLLDGAMKERYNIEGQPMFLVRQRYIVGKEV